MKKSKLAWTKFYCNSLVTSGLLLSCLWLPALQQGNTWDGLAVQAKTGTRTHSRAVSQVRTVRKHTAVSASSHKKNDHKKTTVQAAAKPRYAYPLEFFLLRAPAFDTTPLAEVESAAVASDFLNGIADRHSPEHLTRAGVFKHYPLYGGIFHRRETLRYLVLHSTETGIPVPAKNVINAWSSGGRRHAGAQFVVERDGTIYMAVDPKYGTVHLNIFKTLPGINNDNSIGIEMNHTGKQDYPQAQVLATKQLVAYLQERFQITNDNVITHCYAQQGDHTDPVNFNLEGFLASKNNFRDRALAMKRSLPAYPANNEELDLSSPVASVYIQIHKSLKPEEVATRPPLSPATMRIVTDNQSPATNISAILPAEEASSINPMIAAPPGSRTLPDKPAAASSSGSKSGDSMPAGTLRGAMELEPGLANSLVKD